MHGFPKVNDFKSGYSAIEVYFEYIKKLSKNQKGILQ